MDLRPLLEPRSVAVVGANDRRSSYAGAVLENLERARFDGPVWGVNPNRDEVMGRPCVPSLAELPGSVDAVVVAIPAAGVPGVIRAAGERGCGGAVVLSAGFGEIAAGRSLEVELREAALAAQLPVCGPNGNGIVAASTRAPLWGDSVAPFEPGPVAMVTQSGNLGVNALGSVRGIGWHTVVSTGNQAVCEASDWLAGLAVVEGVRSVALFLESDGDGARLAEALARCAERGVGVAVLKVGASAAGTRAAAAHTGALTGDQRVFRALIEESGGGWASTPHELLELARALAYPQARPVQRPGGGRGVRDGRDERRDGAQDLERPDHDGDGGSATGLAVLTCSGGDSGVAGDLTHRFGLPLPELSPETRDRLAKLLPPEATIANPLDYTAMLWNEPGVLRRVVAAVGDDPQIGQLLLLYDQPRGLSAAAEPSWRAVREALLAGAADSGASTLLAAILPDLIDGEVAGELSAAGVPVLAGLETALACVRALRQPRPNPQRLREIVTASRRAAEGRALGPGPNRCAIGAQILGDGWLGEAETKQLLREAGIPVPAGRRCATAADAVAAANELGYPVALKLSGGHIQHKADRGALELGIGDRGRLRAACRRLLSLTDAAGSELLVERMVPPGIELLVASRADAVVPALVVGFGGTWTELLDDVAIVPLPVTPDRVEAALLSLRGAPILTGARGDEPIDLRATAILAASAGDLLLTRGLSLVEINPVIVGPAGATAVDAVARA